MSSWNQRSATELAKPSVWHWGALLGLILLFSVYYGALAVRQYEALIPGLDLANFDQTVWNTLHGHPFRMTTYTTMTNRLGMHLEPLLLALVPLYALFSTPKMLLVVQVLALALVVIPLYLLAAEALHKPSLALAFPLLYVLAPPIHGAALADFHAVTLGVLPAVAALWALWRRQTRLAVILGGIALLAREDYGLWLAALSVIGWWRTREKLWIAAGLGGLAWFLLYLFVVVPLFVSEGSSPFLERYGFWLEGPQAWLEQGLLPQKGRYLLLLGLMGGAGALLAPLWSLPALPALGLNLLSNYELPVALDGYYSVLVAAILLAASALGLSRLKPRYQYLSVLLLLGTGLWVHRSEGRSPLVPGFQPPAVTAHSEALDKVLAAVPDHAVVSASPSLAPHVSQRESLRIFATCQGCDHILVDVYQDRSRHPAELHERLTRVLDAKWGVVAGQDGVLLLAQGATGKEIPESFYSFMEASHEAEIPMRVRFGEQWELRGFDLNWDYWGRPVIRLYWRALQFPVEDWQPAVLALDTGGQMVASPDSHPPVALQWRPTRQWQTGQTYLVEMLPFDAPDEVTVVAGVGAPLADQVTRLRTAQGQDLVTLATLKRHGRGWRVLSIQLDEGS
jgi:uncharacterized membrane protein